MCERLIDSFAGRVSGNTILGTCLESSRYFFNDFTTGARNFAKKSAFSSHRVLRTERVVRLRRKDDLIYTSYVGHPVERVPLNYNRAIGLFEA